LAESTACNESDRAFPDSRRSSCDALGHCTSYSAYDPDDNLTQVSSATGITTQYQYDHPNRRTLIQYGVVNGNPTSTVTLTYDLGDRLCQAVDSKSGTISRQFGQTCSATGQNTTLASGLDFLTQEVTPQGSVTYTPDAAGRRTSMSVTVYGSAQPAVSYTYDAADKLETVGQNGAVVTKCYQSTQTAVPAATRPGGCIP
jgi:hypothetical protein